MTITVGGCRNFFDKEIVFSYLDEVLSDAPLDKTVILSGHCSGVDELAELYAKERGCELMLYPADWKRYGRGAGPIRNKQMVEKSDWVIAFWDGHSPGTASLIFHAQKMKKKVFIKTILKK